MHLVRNKNNIIVASIFYIFFLTSIHATKLPFEDIMFKLKYILNILMIVAGLIIMVRKELKINIILTLFVSYLLLSGYLINRYNDNFALLNISIDLLVYTIIGMIIGQLIEFKRAIKTLFIYFIILQVFCILNIVFFPNIGMEDSGEWRGIFYQKNALANTIVFGLIISYLYILINSIKGNRYSRIIGIVSICLNEFIIIHTQSATGLIASVLISVVFLIYVCINKIRNLNLKIAISLFVVIVIFSGVLFLLFNINNVFGALGKDSSLTGRDVIFQYVENLIKNNFFLGIGYSGIPNSYLINSSNAYNSIGFNVYYSHNGFLEILLQTGIVGMIMYITIYIIILRSLLLRTEESLKYFKVFIVVFYMYFLIYNLSEVTFFTGEGNNFYWLTMCYLLSYSSKLKKTSNLIRKKGISV